MSFKLDQELENTGTRFRLFPLPHYVDPDVEPEEVAVSVPPDKIMEGPADERMFVIDAVNKQPYSNFFRPRVHGRQKSTGQTRR